LRETKSKNDNAFGYNTAVYFAGWQRYGLFLRKKKTFP
jgi:hypothetical protein